MPNLKFETDGDDENINFQSLKNPYVFNTHVEAQNNKIIEISGRVESLAMGDGDSDDENDDDDDECIKRIVFLKDLLREYERTGESREARLIPLLRQTVKLVRQKTDFPLEVGYYAQGILSS